jgi:hypothetical protein
MKTLLSGNYAIAQFDDVIERGKKHLRLHVYVKSGPNWVYQSFIKLSTSSGMELSGVVINNGEAMVQLTGASGDKNMYFHYAANNWNYLRSEGAVGHFEDGMSAFFRAASRNYINKIYTIFRIPVPMAVGV